MTLLERTVDMVANALDLAEDRQRAWLIAMLGLVITAACWWVALTTDPTPVIPGTEPNRVEGLKILVGILVVLAGPFLMIAALLQAVKRREEPDTWNETGLLFNQGARVGERRRRRAIFAAALMAVVHAVTLFLVRFH